MSPCANMRSVENARGVADDRGDACSDHGSASSFWEKVNEATLDIGVIEIRSLC